LIQFSLFYLDSILFSFSLSVFYFSSDLFSLSGFDFSSNLIFNIWF